MRGGGDGGGDVAADVNVVLTVLALFAGFATLASDAEGESTASAFGTLDGSFDTEEIFC